MVEFLQFTLSGISFGMIYAAIALSLVLIWRGTRLLNFAQGGMAMFTTYIALEVIHHTGSYWAGFVVALAAGVVLGAAAELAVIRPALGKPELNAVIITIGLLILLEGLAGIFYGGQYRSFPAAFSDHRAEGRLDPARRVALRRVRRAGGAGRHPAAGGRVQVHQRRAADAGGGVQRHRRAAVRHPGGAGDHRRLGAGGPARGPGGRARHAVDVPLPEQHGLDLRVRLHRGGDRRPRQPRSARSSAGCCSASCSATRAATSARRAPT